MAFSSMLMATTLMLISPSRAAASEVPVAPAETILHVFPRHRPAVVRFRYMLASSPTEQRLCTVRPLTQILPVAPTEPCSK